MTAPVGYTHRISFEVSGTGTELTNHTVYGEHAIVLHRGSGTNSGRDVYVATTICDAKFYGLIVADENNDIVDCGVICADPSSERAAIFFNMPSLGSSETKTYWLYFDAPDASGNPARMPEYTNAIPGAFVQAWLDESGLSVTENGYNDGGVFHPLSSWVDAAHWRGQTLFTYMDEQGANPGRVWPVWYDHRLKTVTRVRDRFTMNLDDSHNAYDVLVDQNDVWHAAGGCHNTQMSYFALVNPANLSGSNINTTTTPDSDGSSYTRLIEAPNGDILIFSRELLGAATNQYLVMSRSTNGGVSFGAWTTIADAGTDHRCYFAVNRIGDRIHVNWTPYDTVGTHFTGGGYMVSDDSGATWDQADGSSQTIPATLANADGPRLGVDGWRYFHSVIAEDTSGGPVISVLESNGGPGDLWVATYNSGWVNTALDDSGNDYWDVADIIKDSDGVLHLRSRSVEPAAEGIYEWTANASTPTSWTNNGIPRSDLEGDRNRPIHPSTRTYASGRAPLFADELISIVEDHDNDEVIIYDPRQSVVANPWTRTNTNVKALRGVIEARALGVTSTQMESIACTVPSTFELYYSAIFENGSGGTDANIRIGFSSSQTEGWVPGSLTADGLFIRHKWADFFSELQFLTQSQDGGSTSATANNFVAGNNNQKMIKLTRSSSTATRLNAWDDVVCVEQMDHSGGSADLDFTVPATITGLSHLQVQTPAVSADGRDCRLFPGLFVGIPYVANKPTVGTWGTLEELLTVSPFGHQFLGRQYAAVAASRLGGVLH